MSKKRMILSLDQRIEVLRRVGEARRVERLLPIRIKQMAHHIEADRTDIVAYVEYKYSRTVRNYSCYIAVGDSRV